MNFPLLQRNRVKICANCSAFKEDEMPVKLESAAGDNDYLEIGCDESDLDETAELDPNPEVIEDLINRPVKRRRKRRAKKAREAIQ